LIVSAEADLRKDEGKKGLGKKREQELAPTSVTKSRNFPKGTRKTKSGGVGKTEGGTAVGAPLFLGGKGIGGVGKLTFVENLRTRGASGREHSEGDADWVKREWGKGLESNRNYRRAGPRKTLSRRTRLGITVIVVWGGSGRRG